LKRVKSSRYARALEEAATWLVELEADDADGAVRQKLDAWLRASPEHVQAYLEAFSVWENATLLTSCARRARRM
jgi:ferric-dicitrate binding protein FerR (iron transport regulator)